MKNVRSEEGATFGSLGECVAFLKGASMASRFVGKHDLGDAFIGELNFRAGSKAGYHRSMVVFDNGGATFEDLDDLDEPKKC